MAKRGYFVVSGDFHAPAVYAPALAKKLVIRNRRGWVRADLAPYKTREEADGFMRRLARFAQQSRS